MVVSDVPAPLREELRIEIDTDTDSNGSHENSEPILIAQTAEMLNMEATVASAVANEKARLRAQHAALDKSLSKYIENNGNNLYPSRDEKEKLALQMNITYNQVNRWFANRRRKQTKRKAAPSPACLTPMSTPSIPLDSHHLSSCQHSPHMTTQQVPAVSAVSRLAGTEMLNAILQSASLAARSTEGGGNEVAEDKAEMVAQQQMLMEPSRIGNGELEDIAYHQVPEVNSSQLTINELAVKLLNSIGALSPTMPSVQQLLTLQQLVTVNPMFLLQLNQLIAASQTAQMMAAQHQQLFHAHQHAPNMSYQTSTSTPMGQWPGSSSISASPALVSDSDVSDLSELSPQPLTPQSLGHPTLKNAEVNPLRESLSRYTEAEHDIIDLLSNMPKFYLS